MLDDLAQFRASVGSSVDLKSIGIRCLEILKEEIQKNVYGAYDPTVYERTGQLIDGLYFDVEADGSILIQWDIVSYVSVVDGSDQSDNVVNFVNYGHKDNSGIDNMYHNYPGRGFLESASERMAKELGVIVKVMKDGVVIYEAGEVSENWVLV